MTAIAITALAGLPVDRLLHGRDHEERVVLLAAARRAWELLDVLQRNQAAHVVNALAKAIR